MANFTKEFSIIAQYICDEYERRKSKRTDLENEWKEIDRQIKMIPETGHKKDAMGNTITHLSWMPEVELPLQAQTLEVLTADARRMLFPDSGIWYRANAEMTDEYLASHDLTAIISGDKAEVPSHIDQDNINKLVQGTIEHWHRQYDFRGNVDLINAESFKYSVGVGRCRLVKKRVFMNTAKGVVKSETRIPVLFPSSIKNTYLDESKAFLMNEGHMMGPMVIRKKTQSITDLQKAAAGSNDPNSEYGGWIPKNLKGLDGNDRGEVEVLEAEGDLIVPRHRSGAIHIPNAIVTIVKGQRGGSPAQSVVRFRLRSKPYSTYIEFPYHMEDVDSSYGSSPLLKGWPIQKAASDALLRTMIAAQLSALPPLAYDADDMALAQRGGPNLYPGAQIPSLGDIVPILTGDPGALFAIYQGLLQQYSDVTGVNAPRLGAQTVSHTTAYAKEAELNRGVVRTVDYAKSTLHNPLSQWLTICYDMGRDAFDKTSLYIAEYGGFVTINKSHLPKNVAFEAFGAGGPQEEQVKNQNMLAAIQQAMALEQFKALALQGIQPTVNIPEAQKQILRQGGWTDVDVITTSETVPTGIEGAAGMGASPEGAATAPGAALQALSSQV